MRIAILEDDPAQFDLVNLWLSAAGHTAQGFSRGDALTGSTTLDRFDLFLLDWELPDTSGVQVLNWLQKNYCDHAPVIFTTVRDDEEDIAAILKAGADDYIVKPLRRLELLARIDAVIRRAQCPVPANEIINFHEFRVNVESRTITRNGELADLTQKDFDLALFFFRNIGRLLSRGHLLENVWGMRGDLKTRTVDSHASRLRAKLA